jgi:hypothetical protein
MTKNDHKDGSDERFGTCKLRDNTNFKPLDKYKYPGGTGEVTDCASGKQTDYSKNNGTFFCL